VKLWSFYCDLEESLGTFHSTKAVYDQILDLRIATPLIVLNYAHYLEENKYFEESFKVYEKGVNLFEYPYVFDIWVTYLLKFVKRYGGRKLERARDLFEQAIEKVPATEAKTLYILYANLEEEYGLARHAMSVYHRATRAVQESDRYKMYLLYIARATELFGVTRTREIYEKAIETLPEKYVKDMCLRFANMERKLGEIDRARAIYIHASQYCDPRPRSHLLPPDPNNDGLTDGPTFWKIWHEFEVRHGNEETFREMLRIKRTIQAQFNTQVNFMSAEMLAASSTSDTDEKGMRRPRMDGAEDDMKMLEKQAIAAMGGNYMTPEEVPLPQHAPIPPRSVPSAPTKEKQIEDLEELVKMGANPEEINLREIGDNEEQNVDEVELEQLQVPESVFGSATSAQLGARERLKRKRQ